MSILHQFVKHAADLPMWVNVPGLPFNIPISADRKEHLPGMHNWVSTNVMERVSKKLEQGVPADQIIREERAQGDPKGTAATGFFGGAAGGLLGRLISGEAGMAPIKDLLAKGTSKETLKGLGRLPLPMKALPVAGAGIGALLSKKRWDSQANERERAAREAIKGMTLDDVAGKKPLYDLVAAIKQHKEGR